jgi:hypothetical protein
MANAGTFKKGEKRPNQGKRGAGKLTATVKSVFEDTFKQLQKDPKKPHALAKWAEAEPTEFYKLAAKLIPTELKGELNHNHKLPGLDVVAAALGVKKPS